MEALNAALAPILARFRALEMKQRFTLILASTLAVAAGVWGWAAMTAPTYATLFSKLEPQDASQIVDRLRDLKVPYQIEGGGGEIRVPAEQVYETRLSLAGEGLPNGGGVGFEIFDEQRFGESEFSEQVKYHRALEGELSRTIGHLGGVESARVHLVLPSRSLFTNADNSASASVVLKLRSGAQLSREQTRGILHLVASSVRGLQPETVTIVDGSGRKLAGGEDETEAASSSLEFRRSFERSQERSVQQILDATLGAGRSMVRVAADFSFGQEEVTEERVDPKEVVERSHQISEERQINAAVSAGGVAGAVSNLNANPQETNPAQNVLRRSETRNFEISKVTRRAVEPTGRVKRVSVAVVVDGQWDTRNKKRVFTARSADEIEKIRNVVAGAVGMQATRGDSITVECVPFADQAVEPAPEPKDSLAWARDNSKPVLGGAAAVVLLLLVGAALLLTRRKKPARRVSVELSAVTPPALDRPAAVLPAGALPASEPAPESEPLALSENAAAEAEKVRAIAAEIAANDPYLAARIVRGWLNESSQSTGTSQEQAS